MLLGAVLLEQEPHDLHVAALAGYVEGRDASLRLGPNRGLGAGFGEQQLDQAQGIGASVGIASHHARLVEGCLFSVTHFLDVHNAVAVAVNLIVALNLAVTNLSALVAPEHNAKANAKPARPTPLPSTREAALGQNLTLVHPPVPPGLPNLVLPGRPESAGEVPDLGDVILQQLPVPDEEDVAAVRAPEHPGESVLYSEDVAGRHPNHHLQGRCQEPNELVVPVPDAADLHLRLAEHGGDPGLSGGECLAAG
mmetsp:Transcript_4998/g.10530  ORF Transcript_4998/g.10530 Transcript_4998/m.10530 type:complete len:252 (-) Transcript_4998:404-1159(-)